MLFSQQFVVYSGVHIPEGWGKWEITSEMCQNGRVELFQWWAQQIHFVLSHLWTIKLLCKYRLNSKTLCCNRKFLFLSLATSYSDMQILHTILWNHFLQVRLCFTSFHLKKAAQTSMQTDTIKEHENMWKTE